MSDARSRFSFGPFGVLVCVECMGLNELMQPTLFTLLGDSYVVPLESPMTYTKKNYTGVSKQDSQRQRGCLLLSRGALALQWQVLRLQEPWRLCPNTDQVPFPLNVRSARYMSWPRQTGSNWGWAGGIGELLPVS